MTEPLQREKVDFAKLLDELRAAGITEYKISLMLQRKWDTVRNWRTHEPKHSDGVLILRLHRMFVVSRETTSSTVYP